MSGFRGAGWVGRRSLLPVVLGTTGIGRTCRGATMSSATTLSSPPAQLQHQKAHPMTPKGTTAQTHQLGGPAAPWAGWLLTYRKVIRSQVQHGWRTPGWVKSIKTSELRRQRRRERESQGPARREDSGGPEIMQEREDNKHSSFCTVTARSAEFQFVPVRLLPLLAATLVPAFSHRSAMNIQRICATKNKGI